MDKDKKREDYIKHLKRKIMSLMEDLTYMKGELKRVEDGEDVSDSDEEEHFYLDNISGI